MIKAKTINKIADQSVKEIFLDLFEASGFKYLKSKGQFRKLKGNYNQIVSYSVLSSALDFDDQSDELTLIVSFKLNIESPKFDNWCKEKLWSNLPFRHSIKTIEFYITLDPDQFTEDDFYTPTKSQSFKKQVTSSLARIDRTKLISASNLKDELPKIFELLDDYSNGTKLYKEKTLGYRKYLRLLVFENEKELAKEVYLEKIENAKFVINQKLEENPKEAKQSLLLLNSLIKEAHDLLEVEVLNPFEREFKKLNSLAKTSSQSQKIRLSKKLGYEEILRFDTSLIDVRDFCMNNNGEILILTSDKTLIRINESGQFKSIGKLSVNEFYRNDSILYYKITWLEKLGVFACNNFIIFENDEIIELQLKIDKSKHKPKVISPRINQLIFHELTKEFHVLLSPDFSTSYHFVYNQKGALKSTKIIDQDCLRLNIERKEIIAKSDGNSFDILDFDGNFLSNYKYGNGNDRISISPNGNLMVLYFYSAKSQLYDLSTGDNKTLWAHPTHLKGYKDNFYGNINHNFGMTTCTFTPDGKYMIGGGDHGKYVVWDTSTFKRKELFPSESSQEIFSYFYYSKSEKKQFKPYKGNLAEQDFFINRDYNISNISFLNDGEYIIFQVNDCLLTWDSEFINIGHVNGVGSIKFTSNNFLAKKTKEELVVFKRVLDFDDTFESSDFKKKQETDSSILKLGVTKKAVIVQKPHKADSTLIDKTVESSTFINPRLDKVSLDKQIKLKPEKKSVSYPKENSINTDSKIEEKINFEQIDDKPKIENPAKEKKRGFFARIFKNKST